MLLLWVVSEVVQTLPGHNHELRLNDRFPQHSQNLYENWAWADSDDLPEFNGVFLL